MRAPPDSTLETYFAHQFVRMTARRLAEDVIAHAGEWTPDVIVRESTEFGGALAAEMIGVPVAAIQVASPSLITPAVSAAVEPVLNGVRVGLGLPPDRHLARLQATPVLCFAPPALHDPTVPLAPNFSSFRLEPYREEPTLSSPLRELGTVRPLVYATLGTVFNNPAYELPFFPAVLEALGRRMSMSWWPLDLAQIPHRWAHTLRTSTLRRTSLSEPCWRASSVVILSLIHI